MLTNQAAAAGLDNDTSWTALYEEEADVHGDYVTEVRNAVEYGLNDPRDSAEMACVAAEVADASVKALLSEWSLYNPAGRCDRRLRAPGPASQQRRRPDRACARGRPDRRAREAELPAPAGPGQPANLADALATLQKVANTVNGLVDRHASTTVRALHAAPSTAVLPDNAHETVVAAATLLAKQCDQKVTLNRRHPDETYEDDGSGFGCGCDVTIAAGAEEFNFHRGDSEWVLTRESDGREEPGGVTAFSTWATLSSTLKTAHPQQLVDDILGVVAADRT
ncbi:hypothetical protein ACFUJU_35910 [Streptomyces sp. NPDC057235]|uniref:hypothetical protein n=1 Tax=Streptomyces sp. NPDC057235 TaxID=3346058 RepID=UPI003632ECFD